MQRRWKWISTPDPEQSSITWSDFGRAEAPSDIKPVPFELVLKYEDGARYFIADSGGPGTARSFIEAGDQIYNAKGCGYPIILRPVHGKFEDVTDEIRPDTYQFVSTCYLIGFMDGEGVQGDIDWKTLYLRSDRQFRINIDNFLAIFRYHIARNVSILIAS